MIRADKKHKELVVDILTRSFNDNKSVNYIIRQDQKRHQRLQSLMAYSFDVCQAFGEVFLSDDKKGCALALFPEKKKTTIQTVWWDIQLILNAIGISNIKKAVKREAGIKKQYPKEGMYYLWFIGVAPDAQHQGTGSRLLREVIENAKLLNRSVYLETSTEKNIPWYQKHGFRIYYELDLGYRLFFLKNEWRETHTPEAGLIM